MAGNGIAALQIGNYPSGIDNTQRALIVKGTLLIKTSTGAIIQITGWSITSNVVTFTANNALTTGGGDVVTVSNFSGSFTFLMAHSRPPLLPRPPSWPRSLMPKAQDHSMAWQ